METDARPLLKRLRRTEGSAMVLQRVTLQPRAKRGPGDGQVIWRRQPWGDRAPPRRVVMLNAAMIGALAQHLRAREWARAREASAPSGPDLETWAETWRRNNLLQPRGLRGQPRGS